MSDIDNFGLNSFYIAAGEIEEEGEFIPLISEGDEAYLTNTDIPDPLPILPLRNTVIFPGVILPIAIGRESSLQLIREIYKKDKIIGTLAQRDPRIDDPHSGDLFSIGTIAHIIKILEMPDGSTSVIIQGKKRFKVDNFIEDGAFIRAHVKGLEDKTPKGVDREFNAIVESLKDLSLKIIGLSSNIPQEASFALKNIESPAFLVNFVSSNSNIELDEKQHLVEIDDLKKRGVILLEHLAKEVQMLELKKDIQLKVKTDLDKQQKEYFLNQQLKTIQDELGGDPIDQEIEDLKVKAKNKKWSKEVRTIFEKELKKMHRLNPATGEYSVQLNYLQTLLDLPWGVFTKDNFDLKKAERVLDKDHYGLEKVKERILEYLAVLKLKGDLKSPIICLYGPPGVGKTSLGKSVAKAIGRKYIRMSLGGLHDESEIRGHRKTYIGAMPGRIIQSIKKAKSSNPVFILDEIDKVGRDAHGDPSSALLEVLDPEQNNAFYDNYLELEYDLSNVMFIATANTLDTIHPALRDRMELINVSGYIMEEKCEIAKKHLIPKQLSLHGLSRSDLTFPKPVLESMVQNYTRESGVRALDQLIAKVCRVYARMKAMDDKFDKKITIESLSKILGPPRYISEIYKDNEIAGVVTGLAWTAVGGEILYIETSLSKGNGKLTLTGNLGEVMKESAIIALEYLKSHCEDFSIPSEAFANWNVHIHVPEGAIPKDGPSAGITMATSIASAFTQRKVKKALAMTGEITLRGKVLPVGGIKEKILAARRTGITDIILSADNKKDVGEIRDIYVAGLKFHYVNDISEVLEIGLLNQKVKKPLKIN